MISFISPTLFGNPTFAELRGWEFFTHKNFTTVWRRNLMLGVKVRRVIGSPTLRSSIGSINVMGIRNNPEVGFNDSKEWFYNDMLVIELITDGESKFYIFKVTMDPKSRKHKIAHLLEGVYASYTALRNHRYQPGRTAIVQDRDSVLIARTDNNGGVIIPRLEGKFGINIHDSSKWRNSSLGCTVLEPESSENHNHFTQHFKPLIKSVKNKSSIDYAVTNQAVIKNLAKIVHSADTFSDDNFNKLIRRGFGLLRKG